ncbi:zf-HC2 domain-containing protein [Kaarinaea lacus]
MSSPNCSQIQAELLDYLEEEMSSDERERVAQHLEECHNCKKEYKGLCAMLNKAKNLPVEDPGEEFWRQLPQNVLTQVKRERHARAQLPQNNVIDFSSKRRSVWNGASTEGVRVNYHTDFKAHRLTTILAVAATLLLVCNVMLFSPKSGLLWFDQTQFQAHIETQNLSALAQSVPYSSSSSSQSARLGFVEQRRYDQAFSVGSLLGKSFAFVQDKQYQLAAQQLQRLLEYLQEQTVSAVTLSSLRKTVEMLQATNVKTQYVIELMSGFQRDYENFLAHTAPRQVVLYRAGIWWFNTSLAVAAKDANAIGQLGEAAQIDYLQKSFLRMNAPVGVHSSLEEIATISYQLAGQQKTLSDADYHSLQRALQNLHTLLG